MPKKKIAEKVRTLSRPATPKKPAVIDEKAPRKANPATENLSQFPARFENKAGRYELIRVDDGQAYYSFTNHQEKTVDAAMPVITWRKMQKRSETPFKETA